MNLISQHNNINHLLTKKWFILSVFSLALSGLFAIFLVIGRSPYINKILPHIDFFKSSLTIHVNLSVTIWLLGMITSIYCQNTKRFYKAHNTSFALATIASILVCMSIFDTAATAYLNNYIPFINSVYFKIGIFTFLSAIFLSSILSAIESFLAKKYDNLTFPILIILSAIAYLHALYQMEISGLKSLFNNADYFENIF